MDALKQHGITLCKGKIVLRPMTENDWGLLLEWDTDPRRALLL